MFSGQIFEIEFLMELFVLRSPESENCIYSGWGACVCVCLCACVCVCKSVVHTIQKQIIAAIYLDCTKLNKMNVRELYAGKHFPYRIWYGNQ